MQTFFKKALIFVLDAASVVVGLITIAMLATLVGAAGALFGLFYAEQHDFSESTQYRLEVICALLAPVWLGIWLWRRAIKHDDDPPGSN